MIAEKNGKIVWWKVINLLVLFALSIFVLNGAQGAVLYSAVAALFFFSGIFLKKACFFTGILILIAAASMIAQGDIFENISFFINNNG